MHRIMRAKSAEIFPVIQEIFKENGSHACISVTGDSMYPFLRNGIDSVELESPDFDSLKVLDIVLMRRRSGAYILHRVIRKEEKSFFMAGDAQQWIEGPLSKDQLVARVCAVWRKKRRIDCKSKGWLFLSWLWLKCIKRRYFIMGLYRKIRKIF